MNCPKCGKEITENQKFCTYCGAELCQKEQASEVSKETLPTNNKIKDIVKSKPFVISLSLFVVLIVAVISSFAYITYNNNLTSLITPVEQSQIKQMNSTEMLNTLIQQDDDLNKIISKLPNNKVNKVFEIFYKNMLSLISNMNVDDLNITDNYVLTPKTDIIGFEINDWSGVWLNDEYIFNRYSKYLNKSWQEFLELSKNSKERKIRFAAYVEKQDIIKEITLWQKFMSKNPNFAMNENIKKSVRFLTSDIIYNDYTFYDYNTGAINNEQKQGYEEFLKTIDKNTQEYKIVQNCFDELQKNNFKPNSKFYKLLSDYNNNDKWYEDMYKNALESEKLTKEKEKQDRYDLTTPSQVLAKIDELQARYFSIVKRNNALLDIFGDEECQQDLNELKALFSEVEKNIDKNNYFLQKYHEIEKKYAENTGTNTIEINDFASNNYKAIDDLLNETYQEVNSKIPKEDFKQLTKSEIQWIKDVDSYNKVFEQQGFGTIGTLKKLDYEINMRSFRTLLLMLYL